MKTITYISLRFDHQLLSGSLSAYGRYCGKPAVCQSMGRSFVVGVAIALKRTLQRVLQCALQPLSFLSF